MAHIECEMTWLKTLIWELEFLEDGSMTVL